MIGRSDFDRNGAEVPGDMIPCLSVRQPYAWLIVQGIKPVENRTWRTNFRGRVLIHAGVTYPKRDYADDLESWESRGYPRTREEMVGGIVGEAVIVDCVKEHPSPFFMGPWAFVLEQPKAYPKLIPLGGKLGFFGVPSSLIDGVTVDRHQSPAPSAADARKDAPAQMQAQAAQPVAWMVEDGTGYHGLTFIDPQTAEGGCDGFMITALYAQAAQEPPSAALTLDQQYWLDRRFEIIQALADKGVQIMSNKDRVWLAAAPLTKETPK